MRKILIYSGSGIPFRKGKPHSIISEDIDGFLNALKKEDENIEFHIPLKKESDCPSYYSWFNMKKPVEDWDFSEFDEIIVTGSNLGLFGGTLDPSAVGFINGLKTFTGTGSIFFTDTTLPTFSVISKLHERIHIKEKAHGLKCTVSIDDYLGEEDFKKALEFEKSIDKCYTNFYNYDNKFTESYGEVQFVDGFRTALTARSYGDGGLFEKTFDQLIKKACYIGNYKSKRVRRMKKMGIYNQDLIEWYGKIAKEFQEARPVKIEQVVTCYKNHLAAVVIVDPEMYDLGIPHRWIQSALTKIPTFIDANIVDSIKFDFNQNFINFIKINNKAELSSKLEKLKDEEFYNKFMRLQNNELDRFIKADIKQISFKKVLHEEK
jgi:hypothetical protein